MNYRKAKREVCGAAFRILDAGMMPVAEGELSDRDWDRWIAAWDELLDELARRAGYVRLLKTKGGVSDGQDG